MGGTDGHTGRIHLSPNTQRGREKRGSGRWGSADAAVSLTSPPAVFRSLPLSSSPPPPPPPPLPPTISTFHLRPHTIDYFSPSSVFFLSRSTSAHPHTPHLPQPTPLPLFSLYLSLEASTSPCSPLAVLCLSSSFFHLPLFFCHHGYRHDPVGDHLLHPRHLPPTHRSAQLNTSPPVPPSLPLPPRLTCFCCCVSSVSQVC